MTAPDTTPDCPPTLRTWHRTPAEMLATCDSQTCPAKRGTLFQCPANCKFHPSARSWRSKNDQ